MTVHHIVKLDNKGDAKRWYQFHVDKNECQHQEINGWSALPQEHGYILLLPAAWIYQSNTTVPSKNLDVLKQSVPFAIEEELSNDLADNHVAFSVVGDKQQQVSVLAWSHLDALKDSINQHQLQISAIHSEADFCPSEEGQVVVVFDGDDALMTIGKDQTMTLKRTEVEDMLGVFATDCAQARSNDSSWQAAEKQMLPPVQWLECCQRLLQANTVDLLPDQWLIGTKESTHQHRWLTLWSLLLFLSWSGIQIFQHQQASNAIESIQAEQLQLLQQHFPDAGGSELIDPYAAWQSRLKRMNQSSNQAQSALVAATHAIGAVMNQMRGQIDLRSLRLVEKNMEVAITADSLTLINRFQQQLQDQNLGFKVMVGVNEQDQGRFNSVITMEQL